MGCMHIMLGDRFNDQLKDIYSRAFKFILNEMGNFFDSCSGHVGKTPDLKESILLKEEDDGHKGADGDFQEEDGMQHRGQEDAGNQCQEMAKRFENLHIIASYYKIYKF